MRNSLIIFILIINCNQIVLSDHEFLAPIGILDLLVGELNALSNSIVRDIFDEYKPLHQIIQELYEQYKKQDEHKLIFTLFLEERIKKQIVSLIENDMEELNKIYNKINDIDLFDFIKNNPFKAHQLYMYSVQMSVLRIKITTNPDIGDHIKKSSNIWSQLNDYYSHTFLKMNKFFHLCPSYEKVEQTYDLSSPVKQVVDLRNCKLILCENGRLYKLNHEKNITEISYDIGKRGTIEKIKHLEGENLLIEKIDRYNKKLFLIEFNEKSKRINFNDKKNLLCKQKTGDGFEWGSFGTEQLIISKKDGFIYFPNIGNKLNIHIKSTDKLQGVYKIRFLKKNNIVLFNQNEMNIVQLKEYNFEIAQHRNISDISEMKISSKGSIAYEKDGRLYLYVSDGNNQWKELVIKRNIVVDFYWNFEHEILYVFCQFQGKYALKVFEIMMNENLKKISCHFNRMITNFSPDSGMKISINEGLIYVSDLNGLKQYGSKNELKKYPIDQSQFYYELIDNKLLQFYKAFIEVLTSLYLFDLTGSNDLIKLNYIRLLRDQSKVFKKKDSESFNRMLLVLNPELKLIYEKYCTQNDEMILNAA